MTVGELKQLLNQWPDSQQIVVETCIKTGYDEGDIYHNQIKNIRVYESTDQLLVELGGCRLTGGW
jgi:hypothetical protein